MFEDIQLDNTWLDVYAAINRPVDTPLFIQNKSPGFVYIWTGATAPNTATSGFVLTSLQTIEIDIASPGCFAKGTGALFVEEIL